MHLQSRQGSLCGRTGSLVVTLALIVWSSGAQRAEAQTHKHAVLSGNISEFSNSVPYPGARGITQLQIELAHQHTLALKDIGDLRAELTRSKEEYRRQQELFNEGITPRKDLETAREDYQKKSIDLAARRAEMAIDEAALLHKHRVPLTSLPAGLDEDQVERILQDDGNSHSYAEIR